MLLDSCRRVDRYEIGGKIMCTKVNYLTKDTVKSEVRDSMKRGFESWKTGLTIGRIVEDNVGKSQEEFNNAIQNYLLEKFMGILCSDLEFKNKVGATKNLILASIGNIYSGVEIGKMFTGCVCNVNADAVSEYISDMSIAIIGESLSHLANSSDDNTLLCAFDVLRVLCVHASDTSLKYYKCSKLPLNDIAEILKSSIETNIDTLKYKVNIDCADEKVMFGREEFDMSVRDIRWCDVERYTGVKLVIGVDAFVKGSAVDNWWSDKRNEYKSL